MQEIKINVATQLASLRAIPLAVTALQTQVSAANAAKVQENVKFAAQAPDADVVSGKSDKIKLQTTSHLADVVDRAKSWAELLALHTVETIEVEEHEARDLAEIVNTPIVAEEVEKSIRISVA